MTNKRDLELEISSESDKDRRAFETGSLWSAINAFAVCR